MTTREIIERAFFLDILRGLALTLKMFFKRSVTRQYPDEKRPPEPGFRGLHALARKGDGTARCVGCGLCVAVCPSQCIHLYTTDGPNHEKIVERYEIEVLKCLFCSLCVEACPFQAVVLTEQYECADFTKDALYMTRDRLLTNWDNYMTEDKGKVYFDHFWKPKNSDFSSPDNQAGSDPETVR
ncbi:MAG: NADH-quinone oxidoreductase subunit NuoI [Dissulfurispiraceae bacterium]